MLHGEKTEFGYVTQVPVRWSDMDVFQHINHARIVTLMEEARLPWLFYEDVPTAELRNGCVVVDLSVKYKGQLRHIDGPLKINMWVKKLRSVDFFVGYEVRAFNIPFTSPPSVIAETHLAAFNIETQKLRRLTSAERFYLEEYLR